MRLKVKTVQKACPLRSAHEFVDLGMFLDFMGYQWLWREKKKGKRVLSFGK